LRFDDLGDTSKVVHACIDVVNPTSITCSPGAFSNSRI
jgi:hypothetical protein